MVDNCYWGQPGQVAITNLCASFHCCSFSVGVKFPRSLALSANVLLVTSQQWNVCGSDACMPSLENYTYKSLAHYYLDYLLFSCAFLIEYNSSSYILVVVLYVFLNQIYGVQIFSPICRLLSHFADCFFYTAVFFYFFIYF